MSAANRLALDYRAECGWCVMAKGTGIRISVPVTADELLKKHKRALECIPDVGYRVVSPSEHIIIAGRHQKRARKQLRRGKNVLENTDMAKLTEAERVRAQAAHAALSMQGDFMRRTDMRQKNLEQVVKNASRSIERPAEESIALSQRLARLEQRLGGMS